MMDNRADSALFRAQIYCCRRGIKALPTGLILCGCFGRVRNPIRSKNWRCRCIASCGKWSWTPSVGPVQPSPVRFDAADGVWRVAFAFDPKRKAILLVAGDKSGVSERKFYRRLIVKADDRFDAHLARLKQKERK